MDADESRVEDETDESNLDVEGEHWKSRSFQSTPARLQGSPVGTNTPVT